jgi:heavy metal translocating P-type ATPase
MTLQSLPDRFSAVCELCGLPLRFGSISLSSEDKAFHFCCQGCRMVYSMLAESVDGANPARFKESDLYKRCVAAGVIPATEADLQKIYASRDLSLIAPAGITHETPDGTDTLPFHLMVNGMWCPACAWVIQHALSRLKGVSSVTCSFSTDRLYCRYRPDRVAPEEIREAMARLGYSARDGESASSSYKALRKEWVRLVITALLSVNVMMLSWALYSGFFTDLPKDAISKLSFPIGVMALIVFIYGGGPIWRKAWFGMMHLSPGMETLVGMAAGSAFVYSFFNWIMGSIHLYFDTACMLVTLVLLGKMLEQQAKERVRKDLDAFFSLQPTKVRLITEAWPNGRYTSIAQLSEGDQFIVESDDIVPADGRVTSGAADLDESAITGEARPRRLKAGDAVKSGSRVVDGRIIATAVHTGKDTVLGQMIDIMRQSLESAGAAKSKTDRILEWFVPGIVLIAAGTGAWGIISGLAVHEALVRTMTVMVISCPCALGIAIPMTRMVGISLAGRSGILIKDMDAFERAGNVDTIVFDKTGTLTLGRWQLVKVLCLPGFESGKAVSWAAGLEHMSDHEIGRSVVAYAKSKGIQPAEVTRLHMGVEGVQGEIEGKTVSFGSRDFAWGKHVKVEKDTEHDTNAITSRVYMSVNTLPAAIFYLGDTIRPSVPSLVSVLKNESKELFIISGDESVVTRRAADSIGISNALGGLIPAEKAAFIDELRQQGRLTMMVGDGVNDAAAMARAYLAVAVHSGRPLAAEAAHLSLMRGDPAQLIDFFRLSRQVNRKVTQNLGCAWIYNLFSIPIAMSGLLTPLVAATAMLLSSLTVIGNTLLLARKNT